VLADDASTGASPRCYFCGRAIAENEVRKTEYHVGHGHKIMVMICPVCQRMKERGEGPFASQIGCQTVFSVTAIAAFVLIFLVFVLPGILESNRRHEEFRKKFDEDWNQAVKRQDEFRKKFDEQWNRNRHGF
jgi:hypothetical protein